MAINEQNSDHYALVIGIDTYPELFRLRSAHADAVSFAEWLQSPDGGNLPAKNVKLLIGPEEVDVNADVPSPIQFHIDRRLEMFGVEGNMRIGRRLYFYFAGHGFGPEPDDVGMLMIDASEVNLNSNLSLREYRRFFLDHHLFDEIIYILDCCRDPAPNVSGLQLRGPGFTLAAQRNGVRDYVILAAAYGEKAYALNSADNGQRRGVLTRALLEGLQKEYDMLGRVTSATLRNYLLSRVPDLAGTPDLQADKKLIGQKPQIPELPDPPIVFRTAAVGTLPTIRVEVTVGPALSGKVVLQDGIGNELDSIVAADAREGNPWVLNLQKAALAYAVVHQPDGPQAIITPSKVTEEPHKVHLS